MSRTDDEWDDEIQQLKAQLKEAQAERERLAREVAGLRYAIKGRLERTEALIALGKGEWPNKNYVKDDQWSSWHHEVLTLKGILFAADHYNPEAEAAIQQAK